MLSKYTGDILIAYNSVRGIVLLGKYQSVHPHPYSIKMENIQELENRAFQNGKQTNGSALSVSSPLCLLTPEEEKAKIQKKSGGKFAGSAYFTVRDSVGRNAVAAVDT